MSHRIAVIGTGYVGLVSGTCLADVGNSVLCIDVDPEKVARLRRGETPIFEPGLGRLLERNIREGRITFSLDLVEAVRDCEILMLCLPTPPGKGGAADLSAVISTAEKIADIIKALDITAPRVVINKSTVPVGTGERVQKVFSDRTPDREVFVVSNPEFLREGLAVEDFMKPDRVVVGTDSPYATEILRELYEPFVREGAPILFFDVKSAEITKYAANAFLAVKISFMNDLSEYCERVGADIESVRTGVGADHRIGKRFLFSGIGYGGSCFPKDVQAIMHASKEEGVTLEIIEAAHNVNRQQADRFIARIRDRFDGKLDGRVFGLWGLAFKPDTDDVREAPAFRIIDALLADGASIQAYDPEARETTRAVYADRITYATSPYNAATAVDALIVATEWNEFLNPDWGKVRELMSTPIIFDGRNVYSLDLMQAERFEYHSIGRASVTPVDVDVEPVPRG